MLSNPQQIQQYLSQGGLPYSEDLKMHICNQLVSLSSQYLSLSLKTATYTHTDGRTVTLLQADGTVPILFLNVTYNIPVVIWLPDTFPSQPPLVNVNPTQDMVIKRPHPFDDPSGAVSVPYIHNWTFPASNLVQLARELSLCFTGNPPLYSQCRNPKPNPNPSPPFQNPSLSPSPIFVIPQPAARPGGFPPSPYGNNSFGRVEDLAEVFR